jgi:carboxypeptidase Taq
MGMSPYRQLETRFAKLGAVEEALAMLGWDSSTMMPTGSADARGEQMSVLQVICHELVTDPQLGDLIAAAESDNTLDTWQRANLHEMRRRWLHETAVPAELVAALSKASLECEMIWREARPAGDFARVLPSLRGLLDLTREAGQARAEKLGVPLYDALLDAYEPGGSAEEIDRLFAELAGFLPDLVQEAIEHQARQTAPIPLAGPFPIAAQKALGIRLMETLGFDFAHGRLDVSAHPFSGGTPDDVRITTRYAEEDFTRALMGVLHETGHALYERGLPPAWRRQPVGYARGMSIHESQSLLMEMQACRSPEFMEFLAPLARGVFAGHGVDTSGPAWTPENLWRLGTRVQRSLIRVDADEATYPAHVVLRYRLERALIEQRLDLAELPGAWNEGMRELLGIAPANDREGCLQDIHWYGGSWGYFPTYTLGAMTAAQLFEAATRADPKIRPGLAHGDFAALLAWLRPNVHQRASSVSAREIVTEATGRPLDTAVFERHLRARYLS